MRDNELAAIDEALKNINEKLGDVNEFMTEVKVLMAVRERQLMEVTEDIKNIELRCDKTDVKLDGLLTKIGRWESKMGAFLFIGSCLWAMIVASKDYMLALVKG